MAVTSGEGDVGLDHGPAEYVSACCCSSFVLVRLAVGLLLSLALKGCTDLPYARVVRVFNVAVGCSCAGEWL